MSRAKKVAVLPGDGIGPEIVEQAVRVLHQVEKKFGCSLEFSYGMIGGGAIDRAGTPLPDETLQLCKQCDAVLLGAVGGPAWDHYPPEIRPEKALLQLRKELGLFSNLRPVMQFDGLESSSALRPEVIKDVDLVVVRELTGGIYFGEKTRINTPDGEVASDLLIYHEYEVERIVRQAFEIAEKRRKKVTSVDKANVLESSRLWRKVAEKVSQEYPDVTLEHMLVDNCAMQIVQRPSTFDVLVTENMFGDILSDEAAVLSGSIGLLPSASLGRGTFGLYEPVHGSAPDIAGQGVANPAATLLSAAMMLRYSFGYHEAANAVEEAVKQVIAKGFRTPDLIKEGQIKMAVDTEEFGALVIKEIDQSEVAPETKANAKVGIR
ncbi:3-isopropylmalate dehydrogenase [Thermoactinomyces mirandus]|uniref:3-isopropylmalate dehydrogenase n=1 Tax=Thermoactinomyces mirandus TaxID=2756294 RepID=A0A7W2AQM3_9BACL|nr:3-isopropylmalate dehydrogenase [Thermoactinomyces mirandus]MBA4601658.1 3-isopropylmalate dehydrogenase [Thermoactinomyces mirandus]